MRNEIRSLSPFAAPSLFFIFPSSLCFFPLCSRCLCGSFLSQRNSDPTADVLLQDMDCPLLVIGLMGVEVANRDQTEEPLGVVHDRQVPNAAILQDAAGFFKSGV